MDEYGNATVGGAVEEQVQGPAQQGQPFPVTIMRPLRPEERWETTLSTGEKIVRQFKPRAQRVREALAVKRAEQEQELAVKREAASAELEETGVPLGGILAKLTGLPADMKLPRAQAVTILGSIADDLLRAGKPAAPHISAVTNYETGDVTPVSVTYDPVTGAPKIQTGAAAPGIGKPRPRASVGRLTENQRAIREREAAEDRKKTEQEIEDTDAEIGKLEAQAAYHREVIATPDEKPFLGYGQQPTAAGPPTMNAFYRGLVKQRLQAVEAEIALRKASRDRKARSIGWGETKTQQSRGQLTDPAVVADYLRRAGGDKDKARQLARSEGWVF
jgi:murein DD-endopeptidase MepM/ murein hydrolase activator NlpD